MRSNPRAGAPAPPAHPTQTAADTMPAGSFPNWSNSGAASPRSGHRTRGWKLVTTVVGVAGCASLLTYLTLWLRPPDATLLIVFDAGYERNLIVPPNPLGKGGADRLPDLGRSGGRGHLRTDPLTKRLTRGDVRRLLAEMSDFRGPSITVVIAAHGGRDGSGAYLIPDDAELDRDHRVRVKAFLDALALLPAKTRKLLVFEAATCPAVPALGQFHNDFARGLEALEPDIVAIPNLVVISSAGPDQRSWSSPEWGTTAFLHFLMTGLQGEADRNVDDRLFTDELIEFVGRRTREWVRDYRGTAQEPVVFPRGNAGRQRVSDQFLTLVDRRPRPADPLPTVFKPPADWQRTWDEFARLDRSDPHPVAFAPNLWREYVAWLMRYDRWTIVGADAEASQAAAELRRIRDDLEAARRLGVPPQTLALPFATGVTNPPERTNAAHIATEQFTAANDADRSAAWEQAKRTVGGDSPEHRAALGRALVLWVADDPPTRLPAAPALVSLVTDGLAIRPAELHFLDSLARDLPAVAKASRTGPLVGRVLRLRVRAEEVATGARADVVRPWIDADLRSADAARRKAEDLLFAADTGEWVRIEEFASQAERDYTAAEKAARIVRNATGAWQEAIPTLGGLVEWLSASLSTPSDLTDRIASEAELARVRSLWETVHQLASTCSESPSTERLATLERLTQSVTTGVAATRQAHRDAVSVLLGKRPGTEQRDQIARWWRVAEAALSVPFAEQRRELVIEFRRASRQLMILGDTHPEPLDEPSVDVERERAFDAARRRGLLHLSQFGSAATKLTGDATAFTRIGFEFDHFAGRADAPAELVRAGDAMLDAQITLGEAVRSRAAQVDTLEVADRSARVLLNPVTPDPANALRRRRVDALLTWQADRTELDHWSGGPAAKPYFRTAADTLRGAAERLVGRPVALPGEMVDQFPIDVRTPANVAVTDERSPTVPFRLTATEVRAGPGFVVYQSGETRIVRHTHSPSLEPIRLPVPERTTPLPMVPGVEPVEVKLTGYFRGRVVGNRVPVNRHPVPHDTVVREPVGDGVSVAVRADESARAKYGAGSGQLHFVLDCSGSMRANPDVPGDRGRLVDAVAALETVLKQVPNGVSVSVSAFGQRKPGVKSPEDTFETLLPATVWPSDPADPLSVLKDQLSGLEPWDHSAVAHAALRANKTLKPKAAGMAAVVLISDCADTRFADDTALNPKKLPIKDAVRAAFTESGTTLHVVAIPVTDKAELETQNQFRVVEGLKPMGLFLPPDRVNELVKWIRTASAIRVRYLLTLEGDSKHRALLSGSEVADNWLSPLTKSGKYTLRAELGGMSNSLELRPGERLLLGWNDMPGGPGFIRPNFAADNPALSRKSEKDWTLAVPHQRLTDGGGLELHLLADRNADNRSRPVAPVRVADVWLELTPAASKGPLAVRWGAEVGWPCPAWRIDTRAWPTPAEVTDTATVSAWWTDGNPAPAAVKWDIPTGPPINSTKTFDVPTAEGAITVQSVSLERHEVQSGDGRRETKTCLVVRIASPTGKPFLVRPTGSVPMGSEVRVYREAARTTALFWWDDVSRSTRDVTGFEFVSVAELKRHAELAGRYLVLPPLPPPAVGSPVTPPTPR